MNSPHQRRQNWHRLMIGLVSFSVLFVGSPSKSDAQFKQPMLALEGDQRSHTFFEQGLRNLKDRDYRKAIVAFNQAIQIDPKFKEAYSGRGFAYYQLGDLQQAFASYNQILQLDPTSPSAYSGLALVRAKVGDTKQSAADSEKSTVLQTKFTTRQLYQGQLNLLELNAATSGRTPQEEIWSLIEQGYKQIDARNYRGAVNLFSQAARLAPTGAARPHIDRGVAYFWLRNYRAAIEDFTTVIQFNPLYIKAYEYRARAYQEIGQSQAARADLQKAIEIARQFGNQSLYQELTAKLQQSRQ